MHFVESEIRVTINRLAPATYQTYASTVSAAIRTGVREMVREAKASAPGIPVIAAAGIAIGLFAPQAQTIATAAECALVVGAAAALAGVGVTALAAVCAPLNNAFTRLASQGQRFAASTNNA